MSVSNLKVVMVQKVLLDACGWAAVIDSGMNIDTEIGRVFGPAQIVLLDSVKEEIEQLNLHRPRNKNLLLPLLEKKTEPKHKKILLTEQKFGKTPKKITQKRNKKKQFLE